MIYTRGLYVKFLDKKCGFRDKLLKNLDVQAWRWDARLVIKGMVKFRKIKVLRKNRDGISIINGAEERT